MQPWPISPDASTHPEGLDQPVGMFGWFSRVVSALNIGSTISHERSSKMFGMIGLTLIALVAILFIPFVVYILESLMPGGPTSIPWIMLLLIGSMITPAAAAISNVAVMPMLCSGSVLLRFATMLAITAPGYVVFMISLWTVEKSWPPTEVWYGILTAECGFLAGVAIVIVPLQLWTKCELCGYRREIRPALGLSTLAMMELMVVIAVICAVVMRLNISHTLKLTILVCGGLGSLMAVVSVLMIVGILGRIRPRLYGVALPLLIGSVTIASLIYFLAKQEFGSSDNWQTAGLSLLDGFILAIMYYAIVRLGIWWIRGCGWQFHSRHPSRRLGARVS